jgi:hypothetical protein
MSRCATPDDLSAPSLHGGGRPWAETSPAARRQPIETAARPPRLSRASPSSRPGAASCGPCRPRRWARPSPRSVQRLPAACTRSASRCRGGRGSGRGRARAALRGRGGSAAPSPGRALRQRPEEHRDRPGAGPAPRGRALVTGQRIARPHRRLPWQGLASS